MVFSRSHNNVFLFLFADTALAIRMRGIRFFCICLAGKLKAGGTCVGAWVHFPHSSVDLGSIGKGCNPPLPPVLFHFPHERFNRIHRAPPYWLFRHSRFPFAKKIDARQCRGRPFLTTVYDCSILLRSDVHPIPTSHRTTSTGHER